MSSLEKTLQAKVRDVFGNLATLVPGQRELPMRPRREGCTKAALLLSNTITPPKGLVAHGPESLMTAALRGDQLHMVTEEGGRAEQHAVQEARPRGVPQP